MTHTTPDVQITHGQPAQFPEQIDLLKNAELHFKWKGLVPFKRFIRLNEERATLATIAPEIIQSENPPFSIDCTLIQTEQKLPWLNCQANATLTVICQRCLQPLDLNINETLDFAVLTEDIFIERLGSQDEYVVLGEEHIVQRNGRHLDVDLLAIIEDEILVSLPLSPKHMDCEHVAPELMIDSIDHLSEQMDSSESTQENPFAELAALKQQLTNK